jgi:hypothetical protein
MFPFGRNVLIYPKCLCTGFVNWATEQVKGFTDMFRRQVYGGDEDEETIRESRDVARSQATMVGGISLI